MILPKQSPPVVRGVGSQSALTIAAGIGPSEEVAVGPKVQFRCKTLTYPNVPDPDFDAITLQYKIPSEGWTSSSYVCASEDP